MEDFKLTQNMENFTNTHRSVELVSFSRSDGSRAREDHLRQLLEARQCSLAGWKFEERDLKAEDTEWKRRRFAGPEDESAMWSAWGARKSLRGGSASARAPLPLSG